MFDSLLTLLDGAASIGGDMGLGGGLAAVGGGLAAIGAGLGIGRLSGSANEAIARQPEAAGDIRGNTIITAAFIEGVCLFAVVVAILMVLNVKFIDTVETNRLPEGKLIEKMENEGKLKKAGQ